MIGFELGPRSFLRIHFQGRENSGWIVVVRPAHRTPPKWLQKWKNLRSNFNLILLLFLRRFESFLLNPLQLTWEVFWLDRVDNWEEEMAINLRILPIVTRRKVVFYFPVILWVFEDFLHRELLKTRNHGMTNFVVLQKFLATCENVFHVLKSAISVFGQEDLT